MDANRRPRNPGLVAARLVGACAFLAAVTFVDFRLAHVNASTAGFTYVVTVLLIASFAGITEAVGVSLVAVACFNYFFLPPVLTFTIADPQNWVALFALLTTALVASRLAARARDRTLEALDRQQEMELLYALSRAILLAPPGDSMARQITIDLARIFGFASVALFDSRSGQTYFGGPEDPQVHGAALDNLMREAAVSGMSSDDRDTGLHVFAVRLGGKPIGSLAVRPPRRSDAALESLANLVAITLERVRVQEESTHLEAARHSEALKSTLLDAIAHEFKTPLTSIKAAASTLVLNPAAAPARVGELAAIVNEESDRLERLVTDAIHMAHIEGGSLTLQRARASSSELARNAIHQCRSALDGHQVSISVERGAETVFGDAGLIELALCQLLDNAAKYSGIGSPIEVHVAPREGGASIEVRDSGAGIPETEQGRIFDKFYRSPRSGENVPGTGMGLSIVREIAKAHGGQVWVESRPGEGARFAMVLPAPAAEEAA